jgi:signal peptide peptidase SppA
MRVIDVLNSPWAIIPDKLQEIQAIYATHLRGEKIDIKGLEAKLGQPLQNTEQGYSIIDGVAVIPIDGVISKRMNLFSQISGGASTELIGRDIKAALADPEAHSLLLQVDSPGGTVDGTQPLAQMILAARGTKPIVTYVDGMMASAAYWIGSAADAAYIGADTAQVGSIGVVASHTDYSRREEMMGVKTTEIYAGKYKRIASSYKPLSEDGKQYIQDMVDYLYSVFVADVAKQRGTDAETVLTNMADGRVFTGRQAVEAGLVDGVATMEQLIAQLNQSKNQRDSRKASLAAIRAALAR